MTETSLSKHKNSKVFVQTIHRYMAKTQFIKSQRKNSTLKKQHTHGSFGAYMYLIIHGLSAWEPASIAFENKG